MTTPNSNSNNPLPDISAITSTTSNFALERYIRQGEINSCTNDPRYSGTGQQCACALSGALNYSACLQGYNAVRDKFKNLDTTPFEPLVWCVQNNPSKQTDSIQHGWLTGCINGIRK